ncbi:MAG: hypothetical protein ABW152_12735 [Candidatus Thiodiazotropha endolucinida]
MHFDLPESRCTTRLSTASLSAKNAARQISSGYKSRQSGFIASIVFNFHARFQCMMAFSRSIADAIVVMTDKAFNSIILMFPNPL